MPKKNVVEKSAVEVKSAPTVAEARTAMRAAFENDAGLFQSYVDNVACIFMDQLGMKNKERRDKLAKDVLMRIFWTLLVCCTLGVSGCGLFTPDPDPNHRLTPTPPPGGLWMQGATNKVIKPVVVKEVKP